MSKTATVILKFTNHSSNVNVTSFAEAAKAMRECINKFGFGASHMRGQCGDVMMDGQRIGVISYNGRAWVGEYPSPEITGDQLTNKF